LPDGLFSDPRVQPLPQKYSCSLLTQITSISASVPSHRGATRDRHGRGTGCGGRGGARDGRCQCGRRSRVVLTPRRWRQVGGSNFADDGGKRARSPGRARRKPLKPLRGECRAFSGVTVVTNARAYYHYTRGCRRIGRPAFPAPSDRRGQDVLGKTRAKRAAGSRTCILLSLRGAKRRSNPLFLLLLHGLLRFARNDGLKIPCVVAL
jgi:hypothetical protein